MGFERILGGVLTAACLFSSTACVVGQKVRYDGLAMDLKASGRMGVAVGALDERTYVKNGEKAQAYVGTLRGGFGNPWDVMTASGRPFATDLAEGICEAMKKNGYAVTAVTLEPRTSPEQVVQLLKASKSERLLFVTILEWRTDTMMNTSAYFNLALQVMDAQGTVLAEARTQPGEEALGAAMNTASHLKEVAPPVLRRKLEQLLNDPKVVAALGAPAR